MAKCSHQYRLRGIENIDFPENPDLNKDNYLNITITVKECKKCGMLDLPIISDYFARGHSYLRVGSKAERLYKSLRRVSSKVKEGGGSIPLPEATKTYSHLGGRFEGDNFILK